MRCARREASPPEPAAAPRGRARKLPSPSSGLTGGRLAAPAGPRRAASPWRRPAPLPVLALLLGALGLFAAAPAAAQTTVWSATLTVDDIDDDGAYLGCATSTCPSLLTEDELEHNGEKYTVTDLFYNNGRVSLKLRGIQPSATSPAPNPGSKFDGMVLHLGTVRLPVGGVVRFSDTGWHNWYVDPQWTDGQQVAVKLEIPVKSPWSWPDGTRHHDKNQIWSTTMAAKALEPTRWGTDSSGCRTGVSGGTCPLAMGANSFTYAGNTYTISDFYHRNGTLFAGLSSGSAAAITAARSLMLIVKYPAGAERRFPLRNLTASGASATASWPVDDMLWGSYGHPHPTDPQRNPAVWAANFAVTLAVVEVPEPVTVTVTSPAPRTHTVTVSVPTAVAGETIISLSTYGRVGSRVQTDLRDPDLVSHCDPMDPWDPVFLNADRKYPMAYIQAGQRSTTFNLCILEVPKDVANQIMTNQVTVYLPRGRSSVTYDINVGSAYGGGSGAAEFMGGEGPGSGGEQQGDLLTAVFEEVPEEHDGTEFAFLVRLSETVGSFSRSPRAWSFAVTRGRVTGVEQVGAGLWRVTVRPASPSDVTVTLAGGRDCDDEPSGAVCTPDGRALSNTSSARVAAAGTPEERTPPGSGDEEQRGPPTASDGEAPGEHGGGVPPGHGGASAAVPGVPGPAAEPGRENRRAHPPVIGRRARAIGSPYCFVPGAAELGALGESARLAYRLDSARDFDLCLWAPDPNWRDAPAYASCRGAGGALPEHASLVRGAGREEISVERAPGLMACVVPAEAAAGGGAWRLRIAPDNPDNPDNIETEDTE